MARKRTKTNRINPGDVDILMDLIWSKDGKVIKKKTEKCYSFVDMFLKYIFGYMTKADNIDIVSTDNTVYNPAFDTNDYTDLGFNVDAGSTVDTWGVVIGQGSTSPAIDDRDVESRIWDGTGTNQLQYGAVSFGSPASDASTTTLQVTRVFTNGSGSSITIAEVGLLAGWASGVLLLRDVLPSIETVNNGQDFTINYKIKATV